MKVSVFLEGIDDPIVGIMSPAAFDTLVEKAGLYVMRDQESGTDVAVRLSDISLVVAERGADE